MSDLPNDRRREGAIRGLRTRQEQDRTVQWHGELGAVWTLRKDADEFTATVAQRQNGWQVQLLRNGALINTRVALLPATVRAFLSRWKINLNRNGWE